MITPADPIVDGIRDTLEDLFRTDYDAVVVYAADGETVIHEGPARIRADGWVELPGGRLLSPGAVHHVDPA